MSNLLEKASIITTPTAYSNGFINSVKPEKNLGSELITNGDFATDSDWSKGTGWTISGGTANKTGSVASNFLQYNVFQLEKKYKLTFDVSNSNNKRLLVYIGGNSVTEDITNTSNGTYTFYGTADGLHVLFRNVDFEGSIDNVSVKEVIGADFTFTRGTAATRVNAQGLVEDVQILSSNLVTNGDFSQIGSELITNGDFSDGLNNWLFEGVTLTEGGLRMQSNGATGSLIKQVALVNGANYKLTFEIKSVAVQGSLRVSFASVGSVNITNIGVYTLYFTANSTEFQFIRNSAIDVVVDNVSVKEVGQGWSVIDSTADNYVEFTQGTARLKFLNTTPITQLVATALYEAGKKYKLIVDVASVTSGKIKIDSNNIQETFDTPGITTRIISPTGNSNINFYRDGSNVDITLNSVSLIEITDDTDLPRINYRGFSYQDVLGGEEIVNGNFENGNANWSFSSGAVRAVLLQGESVLFAASGNSIFQSFSGTLGKTYKISINKTGGTLRYRTGFAGADATLTDINTTASFKATSDTNRIQFFGDTSNVSTTLDSVSVKEVTGQEVVPNSGCGSWLLEPQSTNLIPYSTLAFNGGSIPTGYTTLLGTGTFTYEETTYKGQGAVKHTQLTDGRSPLFTSTLTVQSGVTYTFRMEIDLLNTSLNANEPIVFFNGFDTNINKTINDVDEFGILEFQFSSTTDLTGTIRLGMGVSNTALGGQYVTFAMPQLEAGNYGTSFIPTSGSAVTRNGDLALDAGSSDLISSTEGVLYLEVAALNSINNFESITLSDGGTQNRIRFQFLNTLNKGAAIIQVGGVNQIFKNIDFTDITDFNKIAIKYKQNDFSVWLNGNKIHTDDSGTIPPLSELNFTSGSTFNNFQGNVKCVAVFKEALTDAELTTLTTI